MALNLNLVITVPWLHQGALLPAPSPLPRSLPTESQQCPEEVISRACEEAHFQALPEAVG